jgi:hypothetical protein
MHAIVKVISIVTGIATEPMLRHLRLILAGVHLITFVKLMTHAMVILTAMGIVTAQMQLDSSLTSVVHHLTILALFVS